MLLKISRMLQQQQQQLQDRSFSSRWFYWCTTFQLQPRPTVGSRLTLHADIFPDLVSSLLRQSLLLHHLLPHLLPGHLEQQQHGRRSQIDRGESKLSGFTWSPMIPLVIDSSAQREGDDEYIKDESSYISHTSLSIQLRLESKPTVAPTNLIGR